jgi:outer membrane protein, multidrug efflux system
MIGDVGSANHRARRHLPEVRPVLKSRRLLCLAIALGVAACAPAGPEYRQPDIALAPNFAGKPASARDDATWANWWHGYRDSMLDRLVAQAPAQNLDIATSLARVEAAEATLRGAGFASQIDGDLSAQSTRAGGDDRPATTTNASGLNAGFVFDLFGSTRRSQQQAAAERDAALSDVETARLAMLSALIGNYVDARYYQEALALTRSSIESRAKTLELVQVQRSVGSASELDVARAQADLDSARATLPPYQNGFEASVFAIATLIAQPAEPLLRSLEKGAAQPRPRGASSLGVPADLIRARPDVRAAESRLIAGFAAIGVAEAALYPSVSLTGNLTESSSTSWSFGPQVSLPLLNRSRLSASRDRAVADAKALEQNWRAAVLGAVEDVQAGESLYQSRRREVTTLAEAVTSSERVLTLSRATYQEGDSSLLDLLDAERSNTTARLSLAQAIRGQATAWAQLQVALGRGATTTR